MKKRDPIDLDRQLCPVVKAMSQVGDKWTLLLLRESYLGFRRFDQFQKNLSISKSVLTEKLKRMVEFGLLEKKKYQAENTRTRYEYHLTQKGRDFSKVILALLEWGNTYLKDPDQPTLTIIDKTNQSNTRIALVNEEGDRVKWSDLRMVVTEE